MSFGEVVDVIESYARKKEREAKISAEMNEVLADQIFNRIAKLLDSKDEIEIKRIWDFFPTLFKKEKKLHEEEKALNEFDEFKAKRKKYAKQINARMGGGR